MAHLTILKETDLISEEDWIKKINKLKNEFDDKLINYEEKAKSLIKESLINAIKIRTNNKFGILLSGGLDSSLIALICKDYLKKDFMCFAVGMENSSDLEYSRKVSKTLGLDLRIKKLTLEEIENSLKELIKILHVRDVVKLEIAIVMYNALRLAKESKCNYIFAGAGSEEIFAGYERHIQYYKENIRKLHEESWNGIKSMYNRDLTRDFNIAKHLDVNLLLPFLDTNLIITAMGIDPRLKVNEKEKKIILRKLAFDLGLEEGIAFRKRTAAQYGSKISNAILNLSRKAGFKYKQDYINSL